MKQQKHKAFQSVKRLKRIIKLIAFVCLIALACVGIGISGGVPLPLSMFRKDKQEDNIELIEQKDEDGEIDQSLIKG